MKNGLFLNIGGLCLFICVIFVFRKGSPMWMVVLCIYNKKYEWQWPAGMTTSSFSPSFSLISRRPLRTSDFFSFSLSFCSYLFLISFHSNHCCHNSQTIHRLKYVHLLLKNLLSSYYGHCSRHQDTGANKTDPILPSQSSLCNVKSANT